MSDSSNSMVRSLAVIGVVCCAKAIIDCMFAITIADNEKAWDAQAQAMASIPSDAIDFRSSVKFAHKRTRADEWISMSIIDRFVRVPPFECLKR